MINFSHPPKSNKLITKINAATFPFEISTNFAAASLLSIEFDKKQLGEQELKKAVNEMSNKVSKLSDGVRKNLLLQYANPIIQKQNLV